MKGFFMRKIIKYISLFSILTALQLSCLANENVTSISAQDALNELKAGNRHYVKMHLKHPDETVKRRVELIKGQHPFAAILSCSDSRVPTEIIFDQGLGDLFVVRNAGNVLDDHVIGSIEYAIVHCGVKLVVVMGHESCGAVGAAIAHNHESKYIESIVKSIEPAIEISKGAGSALATDTAKNNAKLVVKNLTECDPELGNYIKEHNVKIIPAFYNLSTGKVEFYE